MTVRAVSNGFLSRLLRLLRLPLQMRIQNHVWAEMVEVKVPHPELNLDDFWAFRRTAE
jgi:hypothetical protein